jgi:BlaI family penicillinase repressor
MRTVPRISESEWRVMKVLWERSPRSAGEVIDALTGETDWAPKTIKTLLNRLIQKKALGYERDGRAYRYYPLVAERDCVRAESRSFLQRVYGGALMPMLAAFLEDQRLSDRDIEDLKRILDNKGDSR